MSENEQTDQMQNGAVTPDDEIELMDLLRSLWKWKYLIIGGTAACAIAAIVITSTMPKIYRIEMIVRPGILSFEKGGKTNYIEPPGNIQALIEAGAFERKILENLAESDKSNIPKNLRFEVTLPKNSSTLKINYESLEIGQGLEILELLGELLIKEYSSSVKYFQNQWDSYLNKRKAEVQKLRAIKRSKEIIIENIENRIHELKGEMVYINENTAALKKERNELLSKEKEESNILPAILYSCTIQENLQLANTYKAEIKNLVVDKETELQKISGLENQLKKIWIDRKNSKLKKSNIQNVQIIQKPYTSPIPIKPNKRFNVILATIIGIFFMVLISVFIESVIKKKRRKASAKQLIEVLIALSMSTKSKSKWAWVDQRLVCVDFGASGGIPKNWQQAEEFCDFALVEPSSKHIAELQKSKTHNKTIINKAAHSETARKKLYCADTGGASLYKPNISFVRKYVDYHLTTHLGSIETVEVVNSKDWFYPKFPTG